MGLLWLAAATAGCVEGTGRSGAGGGIGDAPDTSIVEADGELLELLNRASDHLGSEADWDIPDDGEAPDDDGSGSSCSGACGSSEAQGTCYCDDQCVGNGDCCSDYNEVCSGGADDGGGEDGGDAGGGGDSCKDACGGAASSGNCHCDASCTEYGDCCSDYEAECRDGEDGGDGGDDGTEPSDDGGNDGGDDGGDGGGTSGSCANSCGGQSSSGTCYCEDSCHEYGDCCSDYDAQCGSTPDPDPDPDPSGGGDPAGGTCEGHCGDAAADASCYCDDLCSDNGDCCADYNTHCGAAAPPAEPSFDLAALDGVDGVEVIEIDPSLGLGVEVPTQMAGSACLALIDDDVNVGKILQAAGRSAAKQGARCFGAAVLVAAGTGGTTAPATSVVCITTTAGAGVVGAAKEYIKQKRSDIALCGASILQSALSAILQNVAGVSVYEKEDADADADEDTDAKALRCGIPENVDRSNPDDAHCEDLHDQMKAYEGSNPNSCANISTTAHHTWDATKIQSTCNELATRHDAAGVAADKRWQVGDECYQNGKIGPMGNSDFVHQQTWCRRKQQQAKCIKKMRDLKCDLTGAMDSFTLPNGCQELLSC